MDVQLKRGLLESCVLASLYREDSWGYQIIKETGTHIEISESTLYPILRRLEAGGYLTVYTREFNSRLRKYYRITQSGRQKLADFLSDWREVNEAISYIKSKTEVNINE